MLRQRNIGRGDEVVGEGIFIGDVEEPVRSSKEKITGQGEGVCWKYFSFLMIVVTVLSLGLNVYQFKLIDGYQRDIQELNETHQNVHSEWTADRNSVEECRSEMHKMETHMNNRETEKSELEKEVSRLRRAIQNGGVTANPYPEHADHQEGDTPPTPHPEQGYPTPANHNQLEEQQRQQLEQQRQEEEQKRQLEEQQRQADELKIHEEAQRHQEELQRQREADMQQEAQRQQEEQQRHQAEQHRQQEELSQQQEQQRQQEEQQRQLEEQQRQQQAHAEAQQHQEG